jgi:hypothetical protein
VAQSGAGFTTSSFLVVPNVVPVPLVVLVELKLLLDVPAVRGEAALLSAGAVFSCAGVLEAVPVVIAEGASMVDLLTGVDEEYEADAGVAGADVVAVVRGVVVVTGDDVAAAGVVGNVVVAAGEAIAGYAPKSLGRLGWAVGGGVATVEGVELAEGVATAEGARSEEGGAEVAVGGELDELPEPLLGLRSAEPSAFAPAVLLTLDDLDLVLFFFFVLPLPEGTGVSLQIDSNEASEAPEAPLAFAPPVLVWPVVLEPVPAGVSPVALAPAAPGVLLSPEGLD